MRRTGSGGGGGDGEGAAGSSPRAAGYRLLGDGRRRRSADDGASEGGASLPSRLREVLVAGGSEASSLPDVEGASPPVAGALPPAGA